MGDADPKFQARPNSGLGGDWCVYVAWPSGETDLLTGFANQHEALEWIRTKSTDWTVEKIMQRPT